MTNTLFTRATLITPLEVIYDGSLLVENGVITALGRAEEVAASESVDHVDCGGKILAPGLIDSHIHGSIGFDFMTAEEADMRTLLRWLAGRGITAVLPTLSAGPVPEMRAGMERIRAVMEHPQQGEAKILGIHLEGPFLNKEKRGAQLESAIQPASVEVLETLMDGFEDIVRLMTLAPEYEHALEVIEWLTSRGIAASLGHSMATYAEAEAAFAAGANRVAHLYNAMRPFDHREPGIIGASLVDDSVFTEITLDGVHVHPGAAELALSAKGRQKVLLVTDAMQAAGQPDGVYYRPGNRKIIVKDGAARVESGSLAGSVLMLDNAVRYAIGILGVPADAAVQMASFNIARSLGLEDQVGSLAAGLPADLILLDADYNCEAVYLNGIKLNKES